MPIPVLRDGVVTLRPPLEASDTTDLLATRDREWARWLGPRSTAPAPAACVVVGGSVVGWVDADRDPAHDWLGNGEVNVGYALGPGQRGNGYATRAVRLLVHHLAWSRRCTAATVLIDPRNVASLRVAERSGFTFRGDVAGQRLLARPMPPLSYSDGVVTLRRQDPATDLEAHLEATDDAQIDWLWNPGDRERWELLSADEQRAHQARHLASMHETWGVGPRWAFSGDLEGATYAVYIDCDLANDGVPHGDANISYAAHPEHRGHGYVARAVRLVLAFLREHTGARYAYLRIDPRNEPSLRVARAVDAIEAGETIDAHGRRHLRFRLEVR